MVVAAGRGHRYGGLKQFDILGGRHVHEWSVDSARRITDGVVLVVPVESADDPSMAGAADQVVAGGASRADSVRAGLAAVPASADVVFVHDAARPGASEALFRAVLEALGTDVAGAVPALPIVDTVKQVADGIVTATLDRTTLVRVQTPQAYWAEWLRRAHQSAADATDDAALVEAIGGRIAIVAGEESNLKITTAEDLALVEAHLARRAPSSSASRSPSAEQREMGSVVK